MSKETIDVIIRIWKEAPVVFYCNIPLERKRKTTKNFRKEADKQDEI